MRRELVPEKYNGMSAYMNGSEYLGIADEVTLPSFEARTTTITGAGILGEYEAVSPGDFGSMTCSFSWRTIERNALRLLSPVRHTLDFRGNKQVSDNSLGIIRNVPVRVAIRGMAKKLDLGKLAMNGTSDSTNEFEVSYIKVIIDGQDLIEFDRLNYIFKVNGVDYTAQIRANLGL